MGPSGDLQPLLTLFACCCPLCYLWQWRGRGPEVGQQASRLGR